MDKHRKPTYTEILQKRSGSSFVGREAERDSFRRNLTQPVPDYLIFWIHGPAGIGKTALLERLHQTARENGAAAALSNKVEIAPRRESSIVNAMERLACELEEAGTPLGAFRTGYDRYQECIQKVETDPDAPRGALAVLSRANARLAPAAAKATIVGPTVRGLPPGTVAEDVLLTPQGEWDEYVVRRFRDPETARLVREPAKALTPLFVADVNRLAEELERPVVLCFDEWERTSRHLDDWVRWLLTQGGLNTGVWLVVAGHLEPADAWEPFFPVMSCSKLEVFTDDEAREYLEHQGIEDKQRTRHILSCSEGMPVLVSMLASTQGGSARGRARGPVERFLKWVDAAERGEAVLGCAAARWFDRDVLEHVIIPQKETDVDALFNWLTSLPFVQGGPGHWEYHPTVRRLMLQYARGRSKRESRGAHGRLQQYHAGRMAERSDSPRVEDEEWQRHCVEMLYHRLMEMGDRAVTDALETFLLALNSNDSLTARIVGAWTQAADENRDEHLVVRWAAHLGTALTALETGTWEAAVGLAEALQSHTSLRPSAQWTAFLLGGRARADRGGHASAIADYTRAVDLNPDDATAYLHRGHLRRDQGHFSGATADYDRVIELHPDSAQGYFSRGIARLFLGDLPGADADLSQAIEIDPGNAGAYLNRGTVRFSQTDLEGAIDDYGQVIALEPESAVAYYERANVRRAQGDLKGAIVDYDQTIALVPHLPDTYLRRGTVRMMQGDLAHAIRDIDHAIDLAPEVSDAYWARGCTHIAAGDLVAAVADLDRAVELDPENAKAFLARGFARVGEEDWERALLDHDRAIELDPEDAEAFQSRGNVRTKLGNQAGALADYHRAVELDPDGAERYFVRGVARANQGDLPGAVHDFDRAIYLDPGYAAAYKNRGIARVQMGELMRAAGDLTRVIELAPGSASAYYFRANAWREMGALKRAIRDYDCAIELAPAYTAAYYNRGNTWEELGHLHAAVSDYDRAIELDPEQAIPYTNRADSRRGLGDLQGAVDDYTRALTLDAELAWAYSNLADIYLQMDRIDDAAHLYEKSISMEPEQSLWEQVSLGVIAWHRGDQEGGRKRFAAALDVWDTTSEAGVLAKGELLLCKAIALLGLGRSGQAVAVAKQEITTCGPPDEQDLVLCNLWAQAPSPPEELADVLALIHDARRAA